MQQPKPAVAQGSKVGQEKSCVPPVHFAPPELWEPGGLCSALLLTMWQRFGKLLCKPQQPPHRKPFPPQARALRPKRISCWADWKLPAERPLHGTPGLGGSSGHSGKLTLAWKTTGSFWQWIPDVWRETRGFLGPCASLSRRRTLGSEWEWRPKEETFPAAQSSSQEGGLQQWLGSDPVSDICSQLVPLTQSMAQPWHSLASSLWYQAPQSKSTRISSWCHLQF